MPKTSNGKRIDFPNLTGRRFDKLTVITMKRFDYSSSTNAFWKVVCECGAELQASTEQLTRLEIKCCQRCEDDEEFLLDEILTVDAENQFVPIDEEVIFRGKAEEWNFINIEYKGRVVPVNRDSVTSTGVVFN